MKTTPTVDFDITKNPMFVASAQIAKHYIDAIQENLTHTVEVATRVSKLAPAPTSFKAASDEIAALSTKAAERIVDANHKAGKLIAEQAAVVGKHVEEFKSKFAA